MDIAATNTNTAPTATPGVGGASLAKNFDMFLTLLTKQLQYQDPLSPLDPTQFTSQLVQFTAVEQAIRTNDKLDQLVKLQKAGHAADALGYLGLEIEADGDRLALGTGSIDFGYTLDSAASRVALSIHDSAGQLVRTIKGNGSTGRHQVTWDGRDNNGARAPAGSYTVSVSAVDSAGEPVAGTTSVFGRVTGIDASGDDVLLNIGADRVALTDIRRIRGASTI